ncbi:MAG: HlyD family secretion protein [Gemmatimonadales bacterium]
MTASTTPETAPPAGPSAPKSRVRFYIIGAVGLVVLAWGVKHLIYASAHEGTDNAEVDGHITPIAPKVSAFVSEVRVEDNQPVKAGDTLVVLDGRDLSVRLAQAEADLAAARAQAGSSSRAGQAQAQLEASRASSGSAASAVISAEAGFRKASQDLDRMKGLAAQQIVSAQALDAAQATYDAAQANLTTAQRQANAAESQVAAAAAALTSADARLAAAQATVDNARLQLSYTHITSPLDGVIAKRSVEPGELIQVGQQLMAVVPLHDVWVTANLKETQLKGVVPGAKVEFTVDAYPGRTFTGHVESVSPATGARFALIPPDNATGNFTKVVQRIPVRIAVDGGVDAAHPLRPGMSVETEINTR